MSFVQNVRSTWVAPFCREVARPAPSGTGWAPSVSPYRDKVGQRPSGLSRFFFLERRVLGEVGEGRGFESAVRANAAQTGLAVPGAGEAQCASVRRASSRRMLPSRMIMKNVMIANTRYATLIGAAAH